MIYNKVLLRIAYKQTPSNTILIKRQRVELIFLYTQKKNMTIS